MDRHQPLPRDDHYDAIVVGARCAGAATAMLLAREGFDVVVVDRADLPSDTLSTHSIARGGVVQLSRWGLLDDVLASGAPPIRQVSFHFPSGEALVKAIKDKAGVDHLLAPRRQVLDDILLREAIDSGVSVQTGVSVTATLTDSSGRVTGVALRDRDGRARELHARLVVGADGVRSRIARSVGARVLEQGPPGGWLAYTYVERSDWEGFEFHLGDRSFAGLFPTHDGEANVWACGPGTMPRGQDFVELLRATSPSLAARVEGGRITAPVRSASGLPNHLLDSAGPGWALVGDAGYHRDPITGHGITDAFRDAELLARHAAQALNGERPEDDALRAYATERRRLLAPIFEVTCRLAQYPPLEEFIELQKHLSTLIDAEAAWLADLPPVPPARRVVAA